jgi:plasmid stability protein
MPKMIQLRNVPDDLHRKLKVRAAEADMSLSDYLIREVGEIARRPRLGDLVARMRRRKPVTISESSAEAVRAERESRR